MLPVRGLKNAKLRFFK